MDESLSKLPLYKSGTPTRPLSVATARGTARRKSENETPVLAQAPPLSTSPTSAPPIQRTRRDSKLFHSPIARLSFLPSDISGAGSLPQLRSTQQADLAALPAATTDNNITPSSPQSTRNHVTSRLQMISTRPRSNSMPAPYLPSLLSGSPQKTPPSPLSASPSQTGQGSPLSESPKQVSRMSTLLKLPLKNSEGETKFPTVFTQKEKKQIQRSYLVKSTLDSVLDAEEWADRRSSFRRKVDYADLELEVEHEMSKIRLTAEEEDIFSMDESDTPPTPMAANHSPGGALQRSPSAKKPWWLQ